MRPKVACATVLVRGAVRVWLKLDFDDAFDAGDGSKAQRSNGPACYARC